MCASQSRPTQEERNREQRKFRVPYPVLVATIEQALAAEGVTEDVRRVEAELTAEADLMGVPSHGVRTLPLVIRSIRSGRINPDPKPTSCAIILPRACLTAIMVSVVMSPHTQWTRRLAGRGALALGFV
jgi:hypothetical protein